jgi:hypothetical protein
MTQTVTPINAFEVPPAAGGAFIAGGEGHGTSSGPRTDTRRRRCTGRYGGTVDYRFVNVALVDLPSAGSVLGRRSRRG